MTGGQVTSGGGRSPDLLGVPHDVSVSLDEGVRVTDPLHPGGHHRLAGRLRIPDAQLHAVDHDAAFRLRGRAGMSRSLAADQRMGAA